MKFYLWTIGFFVFFLLHSLKPSHGTSQTYMDLASSLRLSQSSKSQHSLQLKFHSYHLLNQGVQNIENPKSNEFINPHLRSRFCFSNSSCFNSDLEGFFILKKRKSYDPFQFFISNFYWSGFKLPHPPTKELYNSPFPAQKFALVIGRKDETWNLLDKNWNLNLWQATDNWHILHPKQQGGMGIFFHGRQSGSYGHLQASFLVSPVYFRSINQIKIKNDKLYVNTPFGYPLPTKLLITRGRKLPVTYSLDAPKLTEAMVHWNYGAQIQFQKRGFFVNMAYTQKPANEYKNIFQGQWKLNNTSTLNLIPTIHHHRLLGTDIGWFNSHWNIYASLLHEIPLPFSPPDAFHKRNSVYLQHGPATLYGVGVQWEKSNLSMVLQHLYRQDGEKTFIGNQRLKLIANNFSRHHSFFSQATSIIGQWKLKHLANSQKWTFFTKWIYDWYDTVQVFSPSILYQFKPSWFLQWGGDFLSQRTFPKEEASITNPPGWTIPLSAFFTPFNLLFTLSVRPIYSHSPFHL